MNLLIIILVILFGILMGLGYLADSTAEIEMARAARVQAETLAMDKFLDLALVLLLILALTAVILVLWRGRGGQQEKRPVQRSGAGAKQITSSDPIEQLVRLQTLQMLDRMDRRDER